MGEWPTITYTEFGMEKAAVNAPPGKLPRPSPAPPIYDSMALPAHVAVELPFYVRASNVKLVAEWAMRRYIPKKVVKPLLSPHDCLVVPKGARVFDVGIHSQMDPEMLYECQARAFYIEDHDPHLSAVVTMQYDVIEQRISYHFQHQPPPDWFPTIKPKPKPETLFDGL